MEIPDVVYIGIDECVTDRLGQKWPTTYLKDRDNTKQYWSDKLHQIILNEHTKVCDKLIGANLEIEALKAENEELKAKLDKAKWQPIDTAPRGGKSILVTDGYDVCDAYFRGGDWWQYQCGDDWYSTSINPTHWMPLPDAPEQR